jgi:hypothetical protein
MAYVGLYILVTPSSCTTILSEVELHAMRMGPGKHLQGRTLMNGLVKPEEFDYFHEVGFSAFTFTRF